MESFKMQFYTNNFLTTKVTVSKNYYNFHPSGKNIILNYPFLSMIRGCVSAQHIAPLRGDSQMSMHLCIFQHSPAGWLRYNSDTYSFTPFLPHITFACHHLQLFYF